MTFCAKVKEELINEIKDIKPCCSLAEMYGLMLFGKRFSPHEMFLNTENKFVADKYTTVAERLSLDKATVNISAYGKYKISIDKPESRAKILNAFGYDEKNYSRRINWANIDNECCFGAFLRGAFLACGTINDPEKNYHLEFVVPYINLSKDLKRVFDEIDISAKEITRNGSYVLYFKDSEEIVELLTVLGANDSVLELIGVKVYKDVRNNVNRKTNFENANFDRTVNAALRQTEAIKKLKKSGKFKRLTPELQEIAQIRLENPDLSLQQIGEMLSPPLSRSGVNHRLQKIMSLAE